MAGPRQSAPLFSVVMPVYNGARFLGDALGSLKRQEPFEGGYEILAADDGSTDRSPEILREALAGGLPVRVLEGARRGNWVASTNKALREAKGEYVLFLHQDDRYAPSRLRSLREAIDENPESPFFANDTRLIDSSGRPAGRWRAPLPAGPVPARVGFPVLLVQNNFSVPAVMFRRDLLGRIGFLDESLRYTADWDYWLRAVQAFGVVRLASPLSDFRIHGQSQTVADFARHLEVMRADLEAVVGRFAPGLGKIPGVADGGKWLRLARLGVEANLLMAAAGAGGRPAWRKFGRAVRACRFADYFRYARYSRVVARSLARLRAGLRGN